MAACLNHTGKGKEGGKDYTAQDLQGLSKSWALGSICSPCLFHEMLYLCSALSYHMSGVISCCVLQKGGSRNTMWHSINHMCQSGEPQWILHCQQPSTLCVGGRQSLSLPRFLEVSCLQASGSILETWTNVPAQKPERWTTGLHLSSSLLHCSGHALVLVGVHKIMPSFLFCLQLRFLTLLNLCNHDTD